MKEERSQELAEKAVKLVDLWIRKRLPWLGGALMVPENEWLESGVSGTDGVRIFWNPDEVCRFFKESTAKLARRYLHLLLHGLYLHPLREEKGNEELWWLACDLLTEYRMDRMNIAGFERPIPVGRSRIYRRLKEEKVTLQEHSLAAWLAEQKPEMLQELETVFRKDDHTYWRRSDGMFQEKHRINREKEPARTPAELQNHLAAVHRWRTVFESLELRKSEHKRQKGGSAGDTEETIILQKERGYDYRQFLQQFAVTGEERCLDMDSFDYIPYDYSRRMYERLVLLEPLEYKEVRRLSELVIAIDTSGSCSGEIVRRFLEETWSILNTEGQFFRKMNIHVIQCDCVIQEHVQITCEEEWKEYLDQVTVKGGGDTDFTPVFRLVEELRKNGELKDLKGLLYFTDGDGIYPSEQPEYETAFVFLNEALRKGKPPVWAHSLTLDLCEETTT